MIRLAGLVLSDYIHPGDEEAMRVLKSTPSVVQFVKKVNAMGLDRVTRLTSMANSIRVGPNQFASLHNLFGSVCETLDVSGVELFVTQQFSLNAFTMGVEIPQVIVTTELVNRFTEEELRFVLGHEVGHVKSEHVLFHQIGSFLPRIMAIIGQASFGIGHLIGAGFQMALYDWIRKSELSADRAGLLAVQDLDVVQRAFYKMAGVPECLASEFSMDEISRQAQEFEQLSCDDLNKFYKFAAQAWNTHPWTVVRLSEMNRWITLGEYEGVLDRFRSREIALKACPKCGRPLSSDLGFCVYCGYYFGVKC